jgi:hypothetical protein
MKFFQKFERRFGRYAIRNLMYYIVILYAIGLTLCVLDANNYFTLYYNYLALDGQALLHGQIWRIVTFLIYPPAFGGVQFTTILFGIIALFMYHSLGRTLEAVWGAFRFNVFFFMGVLGQVLSCLVGVLVFHQNWVMATGYINLSIFLAFCMCFPDTQFMMFMVIPVKASWLAIADVCLYAYSFLVGGAATRCQILISFANVILFFFMTRNYVRYNPKQMKRRQEFRREVNQAKIVPKNMTRHRCAVCGRTEKDDPELEFRYCSKCNGNYEYCQDHLYTHQHVNSETLPEASDVIRVDFTSETPEKDSDQKE